MSLDSTFRPLATKLLTALGRTATCTKVTEGAYDPATGTVTNTETTTIIHTYQSSPNDTQLASGQYTANSAIFLVSAEELGFVPNINDKITAGTTWTIQRVKKHSSGEYDALYECVALQ